MKRAEKAEAKLAAMPTPACACSGCVKLCETRPCWGTPADIKKLIAAGYRSRLMKDYWAETPDNVYMLSPAIVEYEGKSAPFIPLGRCTFLTQDGKCELHALGLKPTEGRVVMHKGPYNWVHAAVADTWRTNGAQKLAQSRMPGD